MWYVRKVGSLCKQLGSVSTCLHPKYIKFCFQNLGNGREDRNEHRETTFSFDNEKKISIDFVKLTSF